VSPLKTELVALIRDEGPLPISRYMALCLGHPLHGYYMTRDPFGADGDFTTAPEISQMFGELIGLWAANVWRAMGSPGNVRLVELGPGRGTLMADMLRAAKVPPGFREALSVHLVETSPVLRAAQAQVLAGKVLSRRAGPLWHDRIETALDGPVIVVANEFLDALPLDQFVMTADGWRERLVGLDEQGELAFGLAGEAAGVEPRPARAPIPDPSRQQAGEREPVVPIGSVLEHPQAALDIVSSIAGHLGRQDGAALFIDYGSTRSGFGDTLQAMRKHAFIGPLAEPGEADLTVHVDFAKMAQAGLRAGAACHGPATQRDFLLALGLAERAEALRSRATPEQAASIAAAAARLTDPTATGMGHLFKVMALSHPGLPPLPGFDLHRLPEQG
jgi:NADH dehydrogenase [ubiquinone] 1 alpha subcomplex assembly factor 7